MKIIKKQIPAIFLALLLLLTCLPLSAASEDIQAQDGGEIIWPSFRGNDENNAVIPYNTPKNADEAMLYWASKKGSGYASGAIGSPIIIGDNIIFCSGRNLFKMNRFTGVIDDKTGDMVATSNFNIIPPAYADGKIFVGLNGAIQAFDAETLESLWVYSDPIGGQPNCPIVYNNGYIYTAFWKTHTAEANFVCVSVSDENPNESTEAKTSVWSYSHAGGFYWAGCYVCDDFLLVGTDDGDSSYTSDTACLLSLDPKTGSLIDSITNLHGDIRSTIAYDKATDRYYFTSKGGSFYSIAVNEDGTFTENSLKEIKLENGAGGVPMSTSTPVIYNGRAYIGVSGKSQFTKYSGHNITVIDLEEWKIAYTANTMGYPQTSGLLSTAYEDSDGYVYVYFIDNYTPGQVRVIKDKPGITEVVDGVTENGIENCAPVLFTPSGAQAQYAICSPICDEYGTLYFKNDSAHMMAVGSRIEGIEVVSLPDKLVYAEGEAFDKTGMKVVAHLANGLDRDITDYITIISQPLTTLDTDVTIYYDHVSYSDGISADDVIPPETYVNITVLTQEKIDQIKNVENLINEIGDVTLDSFGAISSARSAFDDLISEIKQYVKNTEILTNAENEYKTLKTVFEKIEAIGTVTYNSRENIASAHESYNELTLEQQAKITNYSKLAEAELSFTEIINAIEEVKTKINNIGNVTMEKEKEILSARKAYDELPDESKIGVENISVLESAEAALAGLKGDIGNIEALIDDIGEVTFAKKSKIEAARSGYESLTAELQKSVSNYKKLTDAENMISKICFEIDYVQTKIDSIGKVTLNSADLIAEVRKLYDTLPAESKVGVKNYSLLEEAEEILNELMKPIPGDLDADKEITTRDATIILQIVADIITKDHDITVADVNGDERVTTEDATAVLQICAGII